MSSILKYFVKPKAEEYKMPDAEQVASQLEEMVRMKESIPYAGEKTPPAEDAAETLPAESPETPHAGVSEGSLTFARVQADALLQQAREQADQMIEQAKLAAEAEVAQIHQHAAEEGYSQGYAEGRAKGEQEAMAATREAAEKAIGDVKRFLEQATAMRDHSIDQLRGELLDVAVTVAEKVIHVSLKSSDEIIKRMILSATEKLKRREWVQIYVADCDIKGVSQSDPMLAAALSSLSDHIKIVPMREAESGTCIVEMPDEIIDASASTQLENIRSVIRENTR
ncbi:MAG: FliH/SctL family protein [Butyricicoccus sp.]|nr:FliH/SctL family protein [Butyricicoccus sp.]